MDELVKTVQSMHRNVGSGVRINDSLSEFIINVVVHQSFVLSLRSAVDGVQNRSSMGIIVRGDLRHWGH